MRKLNVIAVLMLVLMGISSWAQIPYSRDFESGIRKGTRSTTGYPGDKYANNYAHYKIDASFDPDTQLLEGEELVDYFFNTPDSRTSTLVLNLYRNIYKKGVSRSRECAPEDITDDGMVLDAVEQVMEGGLIRALKVSETGTQAKVQILGQMKPGDKIQLKIKWHVRIAAQTHHRGGKYGDYSWFVPYWYPQIAVFDDIYGWDNISHTANEEFAFEFANYDVNIRLGHNMVCWATGNLKNMSQIFNSQVIANYNKAIKSDVPTPIIYGALVGKSLKKPENTWHFVADSVPDFVFACSDNMSWQAAGVQLRPSKPRVIAGAVYSHDGFKGCIDMTRKTLQYLSNDRPGYLYPYSHMTIFEGSGGMEFPMMVNEDFDNNYDSDFFTTSHEVTHSYFPFITGMYQNRFGFMDEGLTQYVPQYFQNDNFRSRDAIATAKRMVEYTAGSDINVPIMTPSYYMNDLWVFTVNSYYKPQIAYTVIEDVVGKDAMGKILHDFTHAWAGKHPHPYDFFNMCNTVSGMDLSELIHSWFFTKGIPDLAVEAIDGNKVIISNKGDMMLPIEMKVSYTDGTSETVRRDALVWSHGVRTVTIELAKPVSHASLNEGWVPDINKNNNNKSL